MATSIRSASRLAVGAVLALGVGLGVTPAEAAPARAATVSIPTPADLGLKLVWHEFDATCSVVSPCVTRGWTLQVGMSSEQYVGVAGRLRKARVAREVVADRWASLQQWPGSFIERTRRGVELRLATAQPFGNALMEVMARRGKRIVILQLLGTPGLPPEANSAALQRHAIRLAKRGALPLGEPVTPG